MVILKTFRKELLKYKKSIENSAIFYLRVQENTNFFLKDAQMRNVELFFIWTILGFLQISYQPL